MERKQFTFYRSFFEAIRELSPDDQAAAYNAICAYALDEECPELKGAAKAVFLLAKPNLDASRKKAESGKNGGEVASKPEANRKQIGSKPEANRKQTASKKEKEKEIENKNESYLPPTATQGGRDADFEKLWLEYPKKVGKQPAKKAFGKVKVPVETLVTAVRRQKCSSQWSKDDGQFIPHLATWLNQKRWEDELDYSSDGRAENGGNKPAGRRWNLRNELDEFEDQVH